MVLKLHFKTIALSMCLVAGVASGARHRPARVNCPAADAMGLRSQAVDVRFSLLSALVPVLRPGQVPYANSERTPPFQTGVKSLPHLRDRARPAGKPAIRSDQKLAGEAQLRRLVRLLAAKGKGRNVQFEGWPTRSAHGEDTWTWARYRFGTSSPWIWLHADLLDGVEGDAGEPDVHLPVQYDAGIESDHRLVFGDFLDFDDLDLKPVFGDVIWTDEAGGGFVFSAWNNPDLRPLYARCAPAAARRFAIELPQPALYNDKSVSFLASVTGETVQWITEFDEAPALPASIGPKAHPVQVTGWLPDFAVLYRQAVSVISGDSEATFPVSGNSMRFTRKSSAQIDHQLDDLNDFLEETYRKMGLETIRMRFDWREIPQSNLVAVIPGELKGRDPNPVMLLDHIDTAFAHDVFAATRRRVTVPGANDNATAVAALMLAARQMRGMRFQHDIWLVHLTGEEFPADDLGARHFVRYLDQNRIKPTAMVLLDMIGYSRTSATEFQLNPGDSADSIALAQVALGAAQDVVPGMRALYRPYATPESYLYNTDGIIFADHGLPVLLINEVVNRTNYDLREDDYHQMADNMDNVDFEYATKLAKVALETAARMAASSWRNDSH